MDSVTFHFADGSYVSYALDRKTTDAIDAKLDWKTSTVIYFIRFDDANGDQQRINLAQLRQVTIERAGVAS